MDYTNVLTDAAELLADRGDEGWERVPLNDDENAPAVMVRSATRGEAFLLRGKGYSEEQMEVKLLSWTMMVPKLTEDQVKKWQKVAPSGEVDRVVERILIMSGMREDSAKAAYKSDGDGE